MAICKTLGKNLNRVRLDRGLSITEFSEELGIARSSLQSILNGTGNPRSDTIEHIAGRLCTDYRALLSLHEDDPSFMPIYLSQRQKEELAEVLEWLSTSGRDPDHG